MSREPAETGLRFYADATVLIGLSRIGRPNLLSLLPGPVYVTTRVWELAISLPLPD